MNIYDSKCSCGGEYESCSAGGDVFVFDPDETDVMTPFVQSVILTNGPIKSWKLLETAKVEKLLEKRPR